LTKYVYKKQNANLQRNKGIFFLAIFDKFKLRWDCECKDLQSNTAEKCYRYKSPRGACENALAALIRMMVDRKEYPEPCEESNSYKRFVCQNS